MAKITINTSDLETLTEAARLLNIHRATIRRWIKEGKIASLRIGGRPFISREQIKMIKGVKDGKTTKRKNQRHSRNALSKEN